jgi:hypothetical protein
MKHSLNPRWSFATFFILLTLNTFCYARDAIILQKGDHLFIDDYLVSDTQNLTTTLHPPEKMSRPILRGMGSEDSNNQPYATVIWDAERKTFRMWYNSRENSSSELKLSYMESADGINWNRPRKDLLEIYGFGCSVTDEGPKAKNLSRRYKLIYWEKKSKFKNYLEDGYAGVGVAFSPDGLKWTKHEPHPVLPDLNKYSPIGSPDKVGTIRWRQYAADIIHSTWHPLKKIHVAFVKTWTWPPNEMGYVSPTSDGLGRRLASLTVSTDFINWSTPVRCFVPEPDDFPSIEFYACRGKMRGNQMVNFTCILDEDGETKNGKGIGYTVLSTSEDLINWKRMKSPWLNRSADDNEAADHAVAWVADVITVGNEEFIYYGGYSSGHKKFDDRTLNFARIRKNGFVSRDAGNRKGLLVTHIITLNGNSLTINADVKGELHLRILGQDGRELPGFGKGEIRMIKGNSTAHMVRSSGRIPDLRGQPLRLEFTLRNASLYAFEVQ